MIAKEPLCRTRVQNACLVEQQQHNTRHDQQHADNIDDSQPFAEHGK